jgi:hypothetical protein
MNPGTAGDRLPGGGPGACRVGTPCGPGGTLSTLDTAGNARDAVAWGLPRPVADEWAWGSPGLTSIARIGAHQVRPHRWAVSPTKS